MKNYEVKKIRERLEKGMNIVIYKGEKYLTLEMAEFEHYRISYRERTCYISEAIKLDDLVNHPNKNKEYIELEKYFVEWDIINDDAEDEADKCDWDTPIDVYRV